MENIVVFESKRPALVTMPLNALKGQ
jgi:hypothetical protein